jgi:sugar lactone lactonase YvrE
MYKNLCRIDQIATTIFVGIVFSLSFFYPSQGYTKETKTWTDTPDWASASSHQSITWTDVPGQIQLIKDPPKVQQTPFIYIPNSDQRSNSVTQLDTKTGKLNWTFDLNPILRNSSPSRTTVDANGDVWVGLRGGNQVVWISMQGKQKKVVKTGRIPRAITLDLDGNVWVGNWQDNTMVKLDGKTGEPLLTVTNVACPYGAVADINNTLWVVNNCNWDNSNTLTRISVAGKILSTIPAAGAYGIATDAQGQIWSANWPGSCLHRFSNQGANLGCIPLPARPRGVAVDANSNVWVPCSHVGSSETSLVVKISPTGQIVGRYTDVGRHSIGAAVDADGFVWVISYSQNQAVKINANTGITIGKYPTGGVGPYTYSDMTGFAFQSLSKSAKGYWRAVHSSKCVSRWTSITWKDHTPPGTSVSVRARTAATQGALNNAQWSIPISKGGKPAVPENPWIEIEVALSTSDAQITPYVTEVTVISEPSGVEICNGIDDDCDGYIDNKPGTNQPLTKPCSTPCGKGEAECISGDWSVCSAPYPSPEVCNGKDDDCDGIADNNATCPGSSVCVEGVCARLCTHECPAGQVCKQVGNNKICVGRQSCEEIEDQCKAKGQICRNGICVDPCYGIECPSGYECNNGSCVQIQKDCYTPAGRCPQGQVCRNGKCITHPCNGVTCPDGQFCKNGNCVDTCAGITCPVGQVCKEGRCQSDLCAGITCPQGQVCNSGQCQQDPCASAACRPGQSCVNGRCIDNPCAFTHCPVGQVCRLPQGDCYGSNPDPEPIPNPFDELPPPDSYVPGLHGDGGTSGQNFDNDPNNRPGPGACLCSGSPTQNNFGLFFILICFLLALTLKYRTNKHTP